MKEAKVLATNSEKITRADILSAVIYHIVAAAVGFALCRAVFLKNYVPFGVAFAAGCPAEFLPSVAVGVFIGYFLPAISASGFKYVAAALAVLSVRFMLSFYKKINSNPLFAAIISSVSMAVTGAVAFSGIEADVLYLALEVLVCAAAAVVISRTSLFVSRIDKGLTSEELGCLLVFISAVLSGLYGLSFLGVKISAVLAVALILFASKYGGALSGTIGAIAVSTMFYFAGQSAQYCFIYTVCALSAGLVSSYGKYVQLSAFFLSCVFFSLIPGIKTGTVAFIAEIVLGCLLFAVSPKSAGIQFARIFTCFPQISVNNDLNQAVTMRLKEAAVGIKDVKTTVDEVAARLEGINAPSFSVVLSSAEKEACGGCKMRSHCWEARRETTLDTVFALIKKMKADPRVKEDDLSEEFRAACLRPQSFVSAVSKSYTDYASLVSANSRITQIRQAVGDQFEGVASMLSELADEYLSGVTFDNSAALTAVSALKNIGVCADECSAPIDKYGRMEINLKLAKTNETVLNKRDIMKVLSLACERNFAPPLIKKTSGETFINIGERAAYTVDVGVYQRSAKPGDLCGDAYSYFADGKGHFIMLISDGMGTGGRAAVDSAMASGLMTRLIKSGFGFDCALKFLNSSMLFKSADESLATMDVASIDMHTGAVELYKAGAAPTVVKRGNRTGKAVSTSMPIGILSDVSFDRAGVKLSLGDIVVLLSDGAAFDGIDYIRDELERFNKGTAQDLAERIVSYAVNSRRDGHTDDITVMTAIIKKQ